MNIFLDVGETLSEITKSSYMIGITHQERIRFWLANLPNAPELMQLTSHEKRMRYLLLVLHRSIARKHVHKQR